MTHFPPSQKNTSHPMYDKQEQFLKDYFASNMIEDIPDEHTVKCWIYGHTHFSNYINHSKKIKLLSNQMGYMKELYTNFNSDGCYRIILEH